MTAILSMIWCWLQSFFGYLNDWWLSILDSALGVGDFMVTSVDVSFLTTPVLESQYTWILGATGMGTALSLIVSALIARFAMQSIPFVRWGS